MFSQVPGDQRCGRLLPGPQPTLLTAQHFNKVLATVHPWRAQTAFLANLLRFKYQQRHPDAG